MRGTAVAGRFPIAAVLQDLLAIADQVSPVDEPSTKAGTRLLHHHAGLVVEPSAALGVAAIREDPSRYRGKRVVTVICGSNVLPEDFASWARQ